MNIKERGSFTVRFKKSFRNWCEDNSREYEEFYDSNYNRNIACTKDMTELKIDEDLQLTVYGTYGTIEKDIEQYNINNDSLFLDETKFD